MKRIILKIKQYKYLITSILILLILAGLVGFLFYRNVFYIGYSAKVMALDFKYYFLSMAKVENNPYPDQVYSYILSGELNIGSGTSILPVNMDNFSLKFISYWKLFINGYMWKQYGLGLLQVVLTCLEFLPVVFMIIALYKLFIFLYFSERNDSVVKTKPLIFYEKYLSVPFHKFNVFVKEEWCYFRSYKIFKILFWLILAYGCNLIGFVFEFLGFLVSFYGSTLSIYYLFYDLVWALSPSFKMFWWVYLFFGIVLLYKIFKGIADSRLNGGLMRVEKIIDSDFGLVNIFDGGPGAGKTKNMTYFTLIAESMFRNKLLHICNKCKKIFPYFNWSLFREELDHKIFIDLHNKAQIEKYVDELRDEFLSSEDQDEKSNWLYNYDFKRYGLVYFNNLKDITLFDTIKLFAVAYYFYSLNRPISSSNYAVQFPLMKNGNHFPVFNYGWFKELRDENGMIIKNNSTICSLDSFRLGKAFNNKWKFTFEGGIVSMAEVDKELGNQNTNKTMKEDSDSPNRINQHIVEFFQFIRHPSSIDNETFCKVFCDLQRLTNVSAGFHELADKHIVIVPEKKRQNFFPKIFLLPFRLIFETLDSWFEGLRFRFDTCRSDESLLMYLIKPVHKFVFTSLDRVWNQYGYDLCSLNFKASDSDNKVKSDKTENGVEDVVKYPFIYRIAYADTYNTTTHYGLFKEKMLEKDVSYYERDQYGSATATPDELAEQSSIAIKMMNDEMKCDVSHKETSTNDESSLVQESVNIDGNDVPIE